MRLIMIAIVPILGISMGCATTAEMPPTSDLTRLTPGEASLARSALAHGDAVITIEGANGGVYVGSALVGVRAATIPRLA